MSLSTDMRASLISAFGARYAARTDAEQYGYLSHSDIESRYADGLELWLDLGGIARGEDTYGQTDTVLRSNYRRLRADYPDAFTHVSYVNVDSLGAFANDIDDDLAEVLIGLAHDYPLYDEGDLSALESDEIGEAWDSYLRWDLYGELSEVDQALMDAIDTDKLGEAFYEQLTELDYYPEHDGYEVRWDTAKAVSALRAAIAALTPAPHGWATAGALGAGQ